MIHVFGAILVDAIACSQQFLAGTSSIATIRTHVGGVGHNLFQALGSVPRRFITAMGDGPFSHFAQQALAPFSDQVMVRMMPGQDIGIYLAFMEKGRLLQGATDASTFENAMDKGFLDQAIEGIHEGDIVVADANLLPEALEHLSQTLRKRQVPLVFEPVSIDKSIRARSSLSDLFLTTPTKQELHALLGTDVATCHNVTAWMEERRIEHVIVTLGHEGAQWVHQGKGQILGPRRSLCVSDTTGAGDMLLARLLGNLVDWHQTNTRPKAIPMADLLRRAMNDVEDYLIEREGLARVP